MDCKRKKLKKERTLMETIKYWNVQLNNTQISKRKS